MSNSVCPLKKHEIKSKSHCSAEIYAGPAIQTLKEWSKLIFFFKLGSVLFDKYWFLELFIFLSNKQIQHKDKIHQLKVVAQQGKYSD